MYKVFYKYASSGPNKAVIDSHYITMALDQWCWYWVALEGAFIALVVSIVLLLSGRYLSSSLMLLGILVLTGVLQTIRHLCSGYAFQEVEQITADPARCAEIAEVFHAL